MSDMRVKREAFEKTTVLFGGQPVTSYWNEDKGAYEIDWVQNDFECFCEGWQAAQSVPGFVLVPVESAKFCVNATHQALHCLELSPEGALHKKYETHINALLDAVEAQEKKNG